MKNNAVKMMMKASLFLLMAVVALSSCKKDDDPDPILVDDGFYLKGTLAGFEALDAKGMFVDGVNEVSQAARTGMYEKYAALKAGAEGFSIVEKSGSEEIVWGPATVETVTVNGENSQIVADVQKGTLGNTGKFTVPADGMYHIVIDKNTGTFAIIPVTKWAILGGSTPLGWSDNDMALTGGFSQTSMKWEITGIELRAGDFKFRYSGGWKIEISGDSVKANTNYGGVLSGTLPNLTTTLLPGGANIALATANEGIYTVSLTWTPENGFVSSLVKTGDVTPLDYPAELFMIGDGVGTWDWAVTDLPMVPVHSHPYMFWKIVWLNATGGFKMAPEKAWGKDFGKTGAVSADTIWAKGGDNIDVPGTAGYYMVVVDLKENLISVSDVKVHLIGACVAGNWTAPVADAKFTVDNANEVVTLTRALDAGELRMHAWHKWFPVQTPAADWWQEEFIVLNNLIAFRGAGNDQERVNLTAGTYKIDLNFKSGAGAITLQ